MSSDHIILSNQRINEELGKIYERGYNNGYKRAVEDLYELKQKMEEIIDLVNTKEDIK